MRRDTEMPSDRRDMPVAKNTGQPAAAGHMTGDDNIRAANATHTTTATPQVRASNVKTNTADQNNKKQQSSQSAHKPWWQWFW